MRIPKIRTAPLLAVLLQCGGLFAAELIVQPPTLSPHSTLEVRFDTPMIGADRVGKDDPKPPLNITPPLEGVFKWTSSRSGQFRVEKGVALGGVYQVRLPAGLADLAGHAVPPQEFGEYKTELFKIAQSAKTIPSYGDNGGRNASFILEFNDAVRPADLTAAAYFRSNDHGEMGVKVRPATLKDLRRAYLNVITPTWDELVSGATLPTKASEVRPNAFVIDCEAPLPVGRDWELVIRPGLANASGATKTAEEQTIAWGSVISLSANKAESVTHFERPHEIVIEFNKPIGKPGEEAADVAKRLAAFVHVRPDKSVLSRTLHPKAAQDLAVTLEASYNSLSVSGPFELNQKYDLQIDTGFPGADGLTLTHPFKETLTFEPSAAYVSTSIFDGLQLASGKGLFDVYGANFKNLRVRVKQLTSDQLVGAINLYSAYNERYAEQGKISKAEQFVKDTPFEKLPGQPVFEKTFKNDKPLERGTLFRLNWHEILGPQTKATPVFVEIDADPQDGAPDGHVVARSIVQFTDIGVFVKSDHKDALVYAFSLTSGQPLEGVDIAPQNVDGQNLPAARTDAQGLAHISGNALAWVVATKGADANALQVGNHNVGIWGEGINIGWGSPWKPRHVSYVYADRPVYKPGDTAHVKAISRIRTGDDLSLGTKQFTANMTLRDPHGRMVSNKTVTFNANGTWSEDLRMPEGQTGWYSLELKFDDGTKPKKNGNDDDDDNLADGPGSASLQLRVDDYKANTFEVQFDDQKRTITKDRITAPFSAHYYMGKALSEAKVAWYASVAQQFTPPEQFAMYHFGEAPDWYHYGKDRDEDAAGEDENATPEWGSHGQLTLSNTGTAEIQLPPPPPEKASLPQVVKITADVTDINQQTISASSEFTVPGADFAIGAKTAGWYGTAGKPLSISYVAITPEGHPYTNALGLDIQIERQEWNTVRIQSAGGAATPQNQATLIQEGKASLPLTTLNGTAASGTLTFTPEKSGTYFLTASAQDSQGRKVFTRLPVYVLGGKGFPWALDDGNMMSVQPDKTTLKPGEEVQLVVKAPFAGNALVTVERNRVQRYFEQPVSPENPLIKLPIKEEDAPNVFVSVLLVRGSSQSKQADPMPEFRLGYTALTVNSKAKELAVEVKAARETLKPGEEQTVEANIRDVAQKPVEGAEVNLYAVDEGVLSLMAYQTPNPNEVFHAARPLTVRNATEVGDILPEDEDSRNRGNKGIVIGGGGDEGGADSALRKNFVATAIWSAALTTDANGHVSATFKVPDSLTRYRVMAVVLKGADRFGSGQSAFVINKPLMCEPVVPRFAHQGDELLLKAVVHNTTPNSGSVEVELKLDDTAELIREQRAFALAGLQNRELTNDGKTERRILKLNAGETAAVAFPVKIVKTGTCAWEWRAHTTQWSGDAQSDAVQSKFEITHPAPALSETHYYELTSASSDNDLLKRINPQVLESNGEWRLDVSTSRMSEVRDGLEFLLHYPYGCVEQTTSTLLPWMALSRYEPLFPDLIQKDKVREVLIRGRDRLLSMQTDKGGLAYWPNSDRPLLWASAYGGFGLIKIKEWGIPVADEDLDKLFTWMSGQLRELNLAATDRYDDLCDSAFALYTLAKAGKPEPSYQTILYQRRDSLPEMSRLYLALAMSITGAPEKQVNDLLATPKKKLEETHYFLGSNTALGLRLLLDLQIGKNQAANATITELLNRRNANGHWGTTFSNAWILMALSAADRPAKDFTPLTLTVQGANAGTASLPAPISETTLTGVLAKGQNPAALKVNVPAGRSVYGHLQAKAWPDLKTFQPVIKGYSLQRKYERLTATGQREPAKDLRVGDLIVVTLTLDVRESNRYLALEDPLPSVFEPVNPEFATQNQRDNAAPDTWECDYREMRNDKVLFFTDDPPNQGKFELRYLARVIAEGDVIAPPARIEAMYEPDHYGLSGIDHVLTLPMSAGAKDVAKK